MLVTSLEIEYKDLDKSKYPESKFPHLYKPLKNIERVILFCGIETPPTFKIIYGSNVLGLNSFYKDLNLIFNINGVKLNGIITSNSQSTLGGFIISREVFYDRISTNLTKNLEESIKELAIRSEIENLNNLNLPEDDDQYFQVINETRLEACTRLLTSVPDQLYYIGLSDKIVMLDINKNQENNTSETIKELPTKSIISPLKYNKLSDTNYSADNAIYDSQSNVGANIRYGKYNLPITKVASCTVSFSPLFHNILHRLNTLRNSIGEVVFEDISSDFDVGDFVCDYSGNKFIIWNQQIQYRNSSFTSSYTAKQLEV